MAETQSGQTDNNQPLDATPATVIPEAHTIEIVPEPMPAVPLVPETVQTFQFTFNFDTTQLEAAWQEIAKEVEASLNNGEQQDSQQEAVHWHQKDGSSRALSGKPKALLSKSPGSNS